MRLFVYGSLKRGGRHHAELSCAVFLGETETAPGYSLEPLGAYFALVAADGADARVTGELFEVDPAELPRLDAFEGPDYERREVLLSHPKFEAALAYFKKAR